MPRASYTKVPPKGVVRTECEDDEHPLSLCRTGSAASTRTRTPRTRPWPRKGAVANASKKWFLVRFDICMIKGQKSKEDIFP